METKGVQLSIPQKIVLGRACGSATTRDEPIKGLDLRPHCTRSCSLEMQVDVTVNVTCFYRVLHHIRCRRIVISSTTRSFLVVDPMR
jgi:hypothetical protein